MDVMNRFIILDRRGGVKEEGSKRPSGRECRTEGEDQLLYAVGGRRVNHFPHHFDAASARRNSISTSARFGIVSQKTKRSIDIILAYAFIFKEKAQTLNMVLRKRVPLYASLYAFLASQPRKRPPSKKEMMRKKISANRINRKEGTRMRVYFLPLKASLRMKRPMRAR